MNLTKATVIEGAVSKQYPANFTLMKVPTVQKDEVSLRNEAANMLGKSITVEGHEGLVVESYLHQGVPWTVNKDMTITPGDWLLGVVWKVADGAEHHAKSSAANIVMRKNRAEGAQETTMAFNLFKNKEAGMGRREVVKFMYPTNETQLRSIAQAVAKGTPVESMQFFDEMGERVDGGPVAEMLRQMTAMSEDATREPMYSPGSFPSGDALGRPVQDAPRPPEPYKYFEPSPFATRVGPNYILANVDPNIAPASAPRFPDVAPKPQVDVGQPFDNVRAADPLSPVFKRAASKVRKGTFANLIGDPFRANDGSGA